MQREPSAARMIPPGRVDKQHNRLIRKIADGGFEQRALAQREQPGLVRAARRRRAHRSRQVAPTAKKDSGGPRRVTGRPGAVEITAKTHKAASDEQVPGWWLPRLRPGPRQLPLLGDQTRFRE